MLLSPVYFAVHRLLRLLTRGNERDDVAREIEICVCRHHRLTWPHSLVHFLW